jgi:intraflagellar transport protein 81
MNEHQCLSVRQRLMDA